MLSCLASVQLMSVGVRVGMLPVLANALIRSTVFARKIRHSNFRQGKNIRSSVIYSNPDEFPVSLISAI